MDDQNNLAKRIVEESVEVATESATELDEETKQIVVRAQKSTADALRALIKDATEGNRQALNKIRVFSTVKDPNLAARLALMNRAQRQRYFAEVKEASRAAARKAKKQAARSDGS